MIYVARRANHFGFTELMSSPRIKNISVYQNENQRHMFAHPVLFRRASAVVTDVGRVAVDADVAKTNAADSVRQRRVVLTPRCGRPCTWGHSTSQGATEAKSRSPGRARYKP